MTEIETKPCKKVVTKDVGGEENGFLLELLSKRDGLIKQPQFEQFYLATCKPKMIKGFHVHNKKTMYYTVIKGKVKVVVFDGKKYHEFVVGDENFMTIKIPPKHPCGWKNIGEEDAYLINYVHPAFDPNDPDTFDWEQGSSYDWGD